MDILDANRRLFEAGIGSTLSERLLVLLLANAGSDESVFMGDAAKALTMSRAAMTAMMDRLEASRVARRVGSEFDRRSTRIVLTDEARVRVLGVIA